MRMPATVDECVKIKGISPQKAEKLMPEFLAEIQRYRRENLL